MNEISVFPVSAMTKKKEFYSTTGAFGNKFNLLSSDAFFVKKVQKYFRIIPFLFSIVERFIGSDPEETSIRRQSIDSTQDWDIYLRICLFRNALDASWSFFEKSAHVQPQNQIKKLMIIHL